MFDDIIRILTSLSDGKLTATLNYKYYYSDIDPEIATPLSVLLNNYYVNEEELKKLQRMLEIAKSLVMDANIYDLYEDKCREEGLIPMREEDEEDV